MPNLVWHITKKCLQPKFLNICQNYANLREYAKRRNLTSKQFKICQIYVFWPKIGQPGNPAWVIQKLSSRYQCIQFNYNCSFFSPIDRQEMMPMKKNWGCVGECEIKIRDRNREWTCKYTAK